MLKHSRTDSTYMTVIAVLRRDFSNHACVLEYALREGTIGRVCNKMFFDVDETIDENKTPRRKREDKSNMAFSMDDDRPIDDETDSNEIFHMSL